MGFKVKHLKNLVVRLITRDSYYVCEECHKIHKRDGNEIRLDNSTGLLSNRWWYGSVSRECFMELRKRMKFDIRSVLKNRKQDELYYD